MKINYHSILYIAGIILIAVAISPISVFIMTKILPFNFSEFFLIPGFILVMSSKKEIKSIIYKNLKKQKFVISFYILFLFSILGLITGENAAFVYSDLRTITIFLFFTLLVIKSQEQQEIFRKFVYDIFFSVSLLDLFFLLFRNTYFHMTNERFIVLTVCPFVLSILYLNRNKYLLSGFFLFILIYETIVSTMRINYILVIFYVIYLMFFIFSSFRRNKLAFVKTGLFVGVLIIASLKITPIVIDFLKSDGSRYVHSVVRTQSMVNNFNEEEHIRINTTILFYKEPFSFIIPQGLGWRNHIQRIQNLFRAKYGVLSTMDSSIFYCFYHFGLFFGFLIIFLLFRLLYNLLRKNIFQCSIGGSIYYLVLVGVISSMFVLKSWIFVYLNFGLIYSFLIVLLRYPDNQFIKAKNNHDTKGRIQPEIYTYS